MEFDKFMEKYTLHDSYYVGLFYDLAYDNNIVIAIQWDSVWLPESVSKSTASVNDWPYLFISIKNVENINTWGYKNIDINRAIGGSEYAVTNGKKILAISDVYGGELQIVFTGDTEFLALNNKKEPLNI